MGHSKASLDGFGAFGGTSASGYRAGSCQSTFLYDRLGAWVYLFDLRHVRGNHCRGDAIQRMVRWIAGNIISTVTMMTPRRDLPEVRVRSSSDDRRLRELLGSTRRDTWSHPPCSPAHRHPPYTDRQLSSQTKTFLEHTSVASSSAVIIMTPSSRKMLVWHLTVEFQEDKSGICILI
jgi:hypothetical protein